MGKNCLIKTRSLTSPEYSKFLKFNPPSSLKILGTLAKSGAHSLVFEANALLRGFLNEVKLKTSETSTAITFIKSYDFSHTFSKP